MNITVKYRCNNCGDLHEFEDDAYECCRPQFTEVYLCPQCADLHGSEEDARLCCATPDADDPLRFTMASALEREQAGQERLFS